MITYNYVSCVKALKTEESLVLVYKLYLQFVWLTSFVVCIYNIHMLAHIYFDLSSLGRNLFSIVLSSNGRKNPIPGNNTESSTSPNTTLVIVIMNITQKKTFGRRSAYSGGYYAVLPRLSCVYERPCEAAFQERLDAKHDIFKLLIYIILTNLHI